MYQSKINSVFSNRPNAKWYEVTYPDGYKENIKGIREFCNIHNLDRTTLIKVAKNKRTNHKDFQCRFLNDSEIFFAEHHTKLNTVLNRNGNAKWYEVTYPDGYKENIKGINSFCEVNELDQSHLIKVAHNKRTNHKGFHCRMLSNQEVMIAENNVS